MHLLICDDDARFAARVEQKVRDELAQRGIPAQITVCTRGEEALATPHLELYQVALLDVDLDTMNGISLGRQLRQSSPDIALIYISAYLEFAPEGYTVNAFRYILKRDMERMLPNCLEALFHEKTASGRKDIIKVEGDASWLNLDVLAYLDPNISVTIIENGKAVRKEQPKPPKRLVNIVRCKNPRCISSIEEECDQIFELSSNGKYRCIYCEQELQVKPE